MCTLVYADKVTEIDFTLTNNDTVTLQAMRTFEGRFQLQHINKSPYILRTVDINNRIADVVPLHVLFMILDAPLKSVDTIPLTAQLPYNGQWKDIQIYNKQKLIFQQDITDYFCNRDAFCGLHENYISCPQDCASGSSDGWCDKLEDDKCDPDCMQEADSNCQKSTIPYVLLGIIGVILITVFIILKRKKEEIQPPVQNIWQQHTDSSR